MIKGKLSDHFSWSEMCVDTRYWGKRYPNLPGEKEQENIRNLVTNVLEPIREIIGKPMVITSGFRNQQNNFLVGGVRTSQHLKGEAADFYVKDLSSVRILRTILESDMKIPFDQLICYQAKNFIHVSYTTGRENRGEILYK